MSFLEVFISQQEVLTFIRTLSERRKLGAYFTGARVYTPFDPIKDTDSIMADTNRFIILVPAECVSPNPITHEQAIQNHKGRIQVKPGFLRRHNDIDVLEMTTFETRDNPGSAFKGSYWLQEFKKHLVKASVLKLGVVGLSLEGEIGHSYPAIGYSQAALEELRKGTRWMQHRTFRSCFEPLDAVPWKNCSTMSRLLEIRPTGSNGLI